MAGGSVAMDHSEEQQMEIEALQAILEDDIQGTPHRTPCSAAQLGAGRMQTSKLRAPVAVPLASAARVSTLLRRSLNFTPNVVVEFDGTRPDGWPAGLPLWCISVRPSEDTVVPSDAIPRARSTRSPHLLNGRCCCSRGI